MLSFLKSCCSFLLYYIFLWFMVHATCLNRCINRHMSCVIDDSPKLCIVELLNQKHGARDATVQRYFLSNTSSHELSSGYSYHQREGKVDRHLWEYVFLIFRRVKGGGQMLSIDRPMLTEAISLTRKQAHTIITSDFETLSNRCSLLETSVYFFHKMAWVMK